MKNSKVFRSALAVVAVAAALVGCDVQTYDEAVADFNAGSPPPPVSPPPPPGPPPPPPPPPGAFGPTLSEIQTNVFTPSCTGSCHAGANPSSGLNLEAANSHAELVGIPSVQEPGFMRVVAGDPDNSYLIHKLEGTQIQGGQMPPSGPIPQTSIDTIRQWITNGAMDDTMSPPAAPIRVTSLSPVPNANLETAPTQIIAGFDRELDATSVNTLSFVLTASGGDGTFGEANDVVITPASVTVGTTPTSAVMDLTGVALVDDTYRVSLLGDGGSVIMDLDANALDGEFGGFFPSGNTTAGGDFRADFVVAAPVVIGPTLDQIQAVVLTPSCATAGCHTGGGAILPTSMNLSNADASFMALVGMPSTQQVAELLVDAGNPDNSYLIRKLENAAGITGGQMPLGQAPLDPAVIAEIRQWITDGALR